MSPKDTTSSAFSSVFILQVTHTMSKTDVSLASHPLSLPTKNISIWISHHQTFPSFRFIVIYEPCVLIIPKCFLFLFNHANRILGDVNIHGDIFNTLDDNDLFLYPISSLWLYISCGFTSNSLGAPGSQIQAPSLLYANSSNFPSLPHPADVLPSLQLRVRELLLKSLPSPSLHHTQLAKSQLCSWTHADVHDWKKAHNLNVWSHFKLTDYEIWVGPEIIHYSPRTVTFCSLLKEKKSYINT